MVINHRKLINIFVFAIFINPIIIERFQLYCYALEYGIAFGYLCINYPIVQSLFHYIKKTDLIVILLVLVASVLSIIYPTVHNTYDYSYLNVIAAIIRKFIILLFLYVFLLKQYNRLDTYYYYLYYFSIATSLYVISTLFFISFPQLKDVWSAIIGIVGVREEVINSYGYVGRYGWAGFSGYRNTFDCCVSIIFLIDSRYNPLFLKKISKTGFLFMVFLNLLGTLFYGRIGIFVSLVFLFISLFYFKQVSLNSFILSLGITALLVGLIILLQNHNQLLREWYNWFSAPFINFFTTGSFNNYSSEHLFKDMIFMPSIETLFLGDGYYTSPTGSYYMHTDSGFMRQILFWGIIGTGVTYCATLIGIINSSRNLKVISILFLILFISFEVKGEIYYEIIPLCYLLGLMERNIKRNEF